MAWNKVWAIRIINIVAGPGVVGTTVAVVLDPCVGCSWCKQSCNQKK